jgi:hypothetical protein
MFKVFYCLHQNSNKQKTLAIVIWQENLRVWGLRPLFSGGTGFMVTQVLRLVA